MANLHIDGNTEIDNTNVKLLDLTKRKFDYIEILSAYEINSQTVINGMGPDNTYCGHIEYYKNTENFIEYYGGVWIKDISKYSILIVELGFGGNGNSQLSGGIFLYNQDLKEYDTLYSSGWRNQILMPPSTNYTKVDITKLLYVDDRVGQYTICSIWNTYKGDNIYWNRGFGTNGSFMKVFGILK